jgi:hypothetical protein
LTRVCEKLRIENCARGENMAVAANDVCASCLGVRNLVSSLYTGITDYCSYDCPIGLLRLYDTNSKAAKALGMGMYRCVPCPTDTPFYFVGKCWAECKNDPPSKVGGMFTVPSTEK